MSSIEVNQWKEVVIDRFVVHVVALRDGRSGFAVSVKVLGTQFHLGHVGPSVRAAFGASVENFFEELKAKVGN